MSEPTTLVRLNVGSGPQVIPGWTSIDKSLTPLLERVPLAKKVLLRVGVLGREQNEVAWPRGIVRIDVTKRLPYETGSVDAIYSSHFVEHMLRDEAERFFRESLRVLRPGGILRLAMPDLRAAAREYLDRVSAGDAEAANDFIEFLYFKPQHQGSKLRRLVVSAMHRPHGWMYDAVSLAAQLENIGFVSVTESGMQQGACPNVKRLDTRPRSLFLEARAPEGRT